MKTFFLLFLVFYSASGLSAQYSKGLEASDYRKAVEGPEFVRFDMKTTKAGMITTDFSGFAKRVFFNYQLDDGIYKDINVSIPVRELDTESEDRNEKMHNFCLDMKNHPRLTINIPGPLKIGTQGVGGTIVVRGKTYGLNLEITLIHKGDKVHAQGKAKTSLSKLKIPDPSIWIAKLEDEIEIQFAVAIKAPSKK